MSPGLAPEYSGYGDAGYHSGPAWAYSDEQWHRNATEVHQPLGGPVGATATLPWSDVNSGGDDAVPLIGALVQDGEDDEPRRRRKAPWLVAIILLVGGAAGGALWFLNQDEGGTSTAEVVSDQDQETERANETTTDDEDGTEADETEAGEDGPASDDEEAEDESAGSGGGAGDADAEDDADGGVAGGQGDGGPGNGESGAGGESGGAENTPDEAVTQMFEAMQTADCETFPSTISASSRSMMLGDDPSGHAAACRDMLYEPNDELTLNRVEVVSEDGASAQVSAEVTEFGETYTQELPLVLEDGAWRVDMMAAF